MKKTADVLQAAAQQIRQSIIHTAWQAPVDGVHLGPALSMVEIATALYGQVMRYQVSDMGSPERDRLLLSKGHAALALYCTLHHYGVLSDEQLATFDHSGSLLPALTPMNPALGIDFAGGSLGHGIGYACGIALVQRQRQQPWHNYVVLGDGECNEGSIWESALFAAHQKLSNITAIIDCNGFQSDWSCKETVEMNFPALWQGCGWHVIECDGHDLDALLGALATPSNGKPKAIVARTVKGKGVSFMEHNNGWHRNKMSRAQYDLALQELGGTQ
ncbi:transketolase [Mangrovibacter plantisponsor]|uniref:Transketolase subunit A n=1 Tax=Mangrovibacter plantisponsor TaxID=451513 RepID=A0A317PX60_9ENTR|nr:transketolase [Mangrovibacter plantisponsor]PWW07751.1 transketolase subunit A [Mangrovibacter plantisponsor]